MLTCATLCVQALGGHWFHPAAQRHCHRYLPAHLGSPHPDGSNLQAHVHLEPGTGGPEVQWHRLLPPSRAGGWEAAIGRAVMQAPG